MKRLIFLLVLFTVLQEAIFAQSCLPEGITFTTQAQIDSFQANYPGCSIIQGNMQILGSDISDLSGLSVVDSILGNFTIGTDWPRGNNNLVDLDGLENLKFVGGDLLLHYNASLINIMGLSGLTKIPGDFRIIDNLSLTSLNGLENLDSIYGVLGISNNDLLSDLTGLDNLVFIEYFYCDGNEELMSMEGLNNLNRINQCLCMSDNSMMTNLTGLDNLSYIGNIYLENSSLTSLAGLEHLDSVGDGNLELFNNIEMSNMDALTNLKFISGTLDIDNNDNLSSLEGLIGLTSVGYLSINGNSSLISLAGLENISSSSLSGIWIANNPNLSDCNIQTLCDFLATPTGPVSIVNNATGCDKPPEIAEYCNLQLNCLPFGNYYFITQQDIDNFPSEYSQCNKLSGNISIKGAGITNLDSLSVVDTINGSISICGNTNLISLNGLHNIKTVLKDLALGYYESEGNPGLTDLTGLNNLKNVGRYMHIMFNDGLTSLSGLDSLKHIGQKLGIYYNGMLSECSIKSICDLISIPDETVEFASNTSGCNSQEEVEAACEVWIRESAVGSWQLAVSVFPNPSSTQITIETAETTPKFQLSIFNLSGKEVISCQITESKTVIDISHLPQGIYFVKLTSVDTVKVLKLIKE